jgi:WD40 repeat protein
MSRIFLSHSSNDARAAVALKQWLAEQRPQVVNEIFLDIDPAAGLQLGARWKAQLFKNNSRCEAVICLLSKSWEASHECKTEYRTAEGLGKQILLARLEDLGDSDITSEWQRCDLYADGEQTEITVAGGPPVRFNTAALTRLRKAIEGSGIGPENFVWPPAKDPQRAPYRGWEPFEDIDAAVFYGRDAAIARGLEELRSMRGSGLKSLFVVLGPSGSGKSSFLHAGLIPRLQREDRRFVVLGIMRPERNALTGNRGLAAAIFDARKKLKLPAPLGEIKRACLQDPDRVYELLVQVRTAAAGRLVDAGPEASAPTLMLPVDQAEELFSADAGPQAEKFLQLITSVLARINATEVGLIVATSIRTDRYEVMQNHPALDGVGAVLFNDLKPMPTTEFRKVITGPASRSEQADQQVRFAPDLVARLIADASEGADTLPLLSLTLARLYTDWLDVGSHELTGADYERTGGLKNVVNNEIEEILAQDTRERHTALALLRSAFIPWLATINPDSDQPMRRVAPYNKLPDDSRRLIDALVAKRLMVKDTRDGEVVVEVALESLLHQWHELAGWLREERQNLITADDLERNAAAWESHDRDPAWLVAGTRLADAENLADTAHFADRLAGARNYLGASRRAEDQKIKDEEEHRQAELRHAEERRQAAETLAAAETQAREQAQAHAAVLRKRSRILRAVLAGTAIVAIIALFGFVQANRAQRLATREARDARDALAAQLDTEASTVFSRATAANSDIHALADTLAAQRLRSDPTASRGAFYTATTALNTTRIIIPTTAHVHSVAFSPDGHTLASRGADATVRLWSLTDAAHPGPLGPPLTGHTDAVTSVAFSPDGHTLASASLDHTIRLWNLTDPAHPTPLGPPLTGHTDEVDSVAFSPDGHTLASGSGDETVRLWDLTGPAHPTPLGRPLTGHTDEVDSVAFSPDGHTLASGSGDHTIRLWDLTDPAQPGPLGPTLTGHTNAVASVAFSPDGHTLASGSGDHTIRLWDLTDPVQPGPLGPPLTGHTDYVSSVAFSPDGHTLASGSWDGTMRLWDLDTALPLQNHAGVVTRVAFSPDGHTLASGSVDHTIRLWNLTDPAHPAPLRRPLTGHTNYVWSVAFSPDRHTLASASLDHTIRLWNLTDPAHPAPSGPPLTGHTDTVTDVAFSPDGHTLASASLDHTIRLWNLTDPAHPAPLGRPLTGHANYVWSVAFSPDGHTLASASLDHTIRLWNLTDPAHPAPLGQPLTGHAKYVWSVAFSPDGHTLASGGGDDKIRLWNLTDPAHPAPSGQPLRGHTGGVVSLAFNPDGHTLASGGGDDKIRLWNLTDPAHPAPLGQPLTGHTDTVTDVAFSPDGHTLASGSADATVRLWPTPLDATVATLCSKLTSNISHHDWHDWISPTIGYLTLCPNLPVPQD